MAGGGTAELPSFVEKRSYPWWALLATLLGLVAVYVSTYASMVDIWLRSETFLHCFVILPISAFLVWRRWPVLRRIEVKPYWPGLLAVLALSALWWMSEALGVLVGKQIAAVALLPASVLTVAGRAFARAIAFPLGYLVFAVPFGEVAIPYLIDFTAFFTVGALQLTGIPVLREGAFFSLPSGDFEVAKACSGIRYVLASLAIGTLYGYMIYNDLRKRLAFFFLALLLPIVANGLRAYGIVLLAHYSGMKVAVGVDHLIYGWLFFGLVMLFMFWIGERFSDKAVQNDGDNLQPTKLDVAGSASHLALGAVAVLVLAWLGPALAKAATRLETLAGAAGIPAQAGGWRAVGEPEWQPAYIGATAELTASYRRDGNGVDMAVIRYDAQQQGAELGSAANTVADPREWRLGRAIDRTVDVGSSAMIAVRETLIYGQQGSRLVWTWNEVNGRPVVSNLEIKLREAASLLSLRQPISAAIMVSMPVGEDIEHARTTLEAFLVSTWNAAHECLYGTGSREVACIRDNPVQKQIGLNASPSGGDR